MSEKLDGKLIKSFTMIGPLMDSSVFHKATEACQFKIVNDFHGEYDIDWIVAIENGKEVERWNTKNVEHIEWLT